MAATTDVPPSIRDREITVLAAPVYVGVGALGRLAGYCATAAPAHTIALITDDVIATLPWYRNVVDSLHGAAARVITHALRAGERWKTRDAWASATDALLAAGCGRDTTVVALGGGVVGDVAGFVAATYMRGVPVVQVPTTIVAMVDAAIGGKTGVDTDAGKNLVGAFHRPAAVIVDPRVLATLPMSHVRGGFAEVLKHGAIADAVYFDTSLAFAQRFLRGGEEGADTNGVEWEDAAAVELIARSVQIKGSVVDEDERESGRRETLNFGHTVGHALELVTGYAVPHGEAVAVGMVAEAAAGERLGVTARGTAGRLRAALGAAGLPTVLPRDVPTDALLDAARRDKKSRRGGVRVSLLERLGVAARVGDAWAAPVYDAVFRAALEAVQTPGERP